MALELVGGAFLDAVFSVLLGRIASPEVFNFFKKKKPSDKKLLKDLKIALLTVSAVLIDAEEKQIRNAAVKEWLDELVDVAYDADDLLDWIHTDAEISAEKVHILDSTPTNLNDEIEQKMEEILERFDFIIRQKYVLHLKMGKEMPQKTPTSSVIEACDVYGRDNDKEILIKLLLSNHSNSDDIGVIPIVGMGGIGKTTLAQLIYNDDRVQKEFDLKSWVYVSEDFDICKITKTLLEDVTSCSYDIGDLNSLQSRLKSIVTKKKILFVLDDVWNENYDAWDRLRSPFKKAGAQGSKIIVTTQSVNVASIMQTVPSYNLTELPSEDCWLLFANHAFSYGDSIVYPSLEKIGREIVQKCRGLPLAVKTLAGLLRSKRNSHQWYKVLNSEIWDLHGHESNILPALRLSYTFLPSHLKRCFAYCSIFPKDYEFEKEKLTLLWMAEGLLQQSKRYRRIEDIGHEYFSELVSRSFFQQSRRDKSRFVMHHLVNDLAQFVSGTFSVRLEGNNLLEVQERTRHLSYVITHGSSYINLEAVSKANRLRTFLQIKLLDGSIYISSQIPSNLLIKLRYLRVLSFVGIHCFRLPDSLGELRHLRYLDVSGTEIDMLPQSISNLYNLQTLKLAGCSNLKQLPADMHNLVKLRYLDITGTCLKWMPLHMNKLRNLQELSDFFVGKERGSSIAELGELSDLHGSLFIHDIKHIMNCEDSEKAQLKEKHYLDNLCLDWGGRGDTDNSLCEKYVLDSLQPHRDLKKFGIYRYPGTEFPDWLGDYSFCTLVFLRLKGCRYCCKLPPLGQLPSLKELQIVNFNGLFSVGSEFYGNGTYSSTVTKNFPSLEILKFENMSVWEKWCPDAGDEGSTDFPCLRELHIENCPRLTGNLPCNLPSLTLLIIRRCSQLLCSLPTAPTMHVLNIQDCGNLPFPISQCHQSITSLYLLYSCESLKFFPIHLFPNLKSLDISGCKNLEALTVSVSEPPCSNVASLRSLCISHCPKFVSFPKFVTPKLTLLSIRYCDKLMSLPDQLYHFMPNLQELQLWGCPEILSFPNERWPSSLRSVRIQNCNKFMSRDLEWNSSSLTDLTELTRYSPPATAGNPSTNWTPFDSQIFTGLPASVPFQRNNFARRATRRSWP